MPDVFRLRDFEPPARDDLTPWVRALIQESASSVGPWGTIEDVTLDPVDDNPLLPMVRSFTVESATLEEGWYRVIFVDADDDESQPSVAVSPMTAVPYLPTVSMVANHIRTRTRLSHPFEDMPEGEIAGTFNAATFPTSSQVRDVIREAANLVAPKLGRDVPARAMEYARAVVALQAAAMIELSYFSEQVAANRSIYPFLKTRLDEAVLAAESAIVESMDGGEAESGTGDIGYPSGGGFPTTAIGMEHPW